MPSYQYECKYCFKTWEEIHGFKELAVECPFCENKDIKKVYNYVSQIAKVSEEPKPKKKAARVRNHIENMKNEFKDHKQELISDRKEYKVD